MPRYFFHVEDGRSMPDIEGLVLDGAGSAQKEAARLGGDFLKEHAEDFWAGHPWMLEVHDEAGCYLFGLTLTARAASPGY